MKQERCLICFGDIQQGLTVYDWLNQHSVICGRCKQQFRRLSMWTQLGKLPLYLLYEYTDEMEKLLFQYKEGRDIALAPVFLQDDLKKLHDKFRHYHIVLMPSSQEKLLERGFLPMREMLKGIRLPILEPFYKSENHKQSLQSFENRRTIEKIIKRDGTVPLPDAPLLLVDDVCTSGSTIKWAYDLLQEHTYRIEALVVCAHPRFVESCDKKRLRASKRFSILKHVVRNGR